MAQDKPHETLILFPEDLCENALFKGKLSLAGLKKPR